MKHLFMGGLLVLVALTQTIVTPKTDACSCSSLLSRADCIAKSGCEWAFAKITNSSTNTTTISTSQGIIKNCSGTCSESNSPIILLQPRTYCLNVTNIGLCAQTLGCAFDNNICTIFTGCSAYVQTTNAACQAISIQCTTDGTRCVPPGPCSSYTTQALCIENLATSGAKCCTWIANRTSGTCVDKVCSDAPSTYTTQTQCTGWIAGCLATGKGCATSLGTCSSYTQAKGCSGMIGSDGRCTRNTEAGSTVCRPLICTDAATTLATNAACSDFLSGCLTNGKGCVSTLAACSTYIQIQGCTGLIGSDGPCIANTSTASISCRALACTDAPATTNNNLGCASFLTGCVTTGQGCTNSLGLCSSYTGTITTCSAYVGIDGNCKGKSTTAASCSAITCADAPTTTNTNAACAAFLTGCITTGVGCAKSLGACSSYTGTITTCAQYIGSDGNCTAPSIQTSSGSCQAKVCTDAPNTNTTNSACQAFSYLCVTNGAGCIATTTCETTLLAISCQGNQNCQSNQICLNRSSCANYLNQSQCLLNQQQYSSGGTVYLRACTWSAGACSNQICTALSTSFTTDTACTGALAGCLTNGAGCLDIAAQCTDYKGTQSQCNAFKGLNRTQSCTNIQGATSTANCIIRTCANANQGGTIGSTVNCTSWLAGCNFDGKDNCTIDDCTKYYGTQNFCGAITTAKSGGKPQTCWKIIDITSGTTACLAKTCSQASYTLKTNSDCNSFLNGCVTNGAGCVDPTTECTSYKGTLSTCSAFTQNGQPCSKTLLLCRPFDCTQKTPPTGTANNKLWCQTFVDSAKNNCQYDAGPNCIAAAAGTCSKFVPTGTTDGDKALSCYNLGMDGSATCGFTAAGAACSVSACSQFTIPLTALTAAQKFAYCRGITTDSSNISNSCILPYLNSTTCSIRSCTDYGIGATDDATCNSYKTGCKFAIQGYCYPQGSDCQNYVIPRDLTSVFLKAQYCAATTNGSMPCTYRTGFSVSNCSSQITNCFLIQFQINNVLKSDFDKLKFCNVSKTQNFKACAYKSSENMSCADVDECNTYPAIGSTDDTKQLSCSMLVNGSSTPCTFRSGVNCDTPQSPLTSCAGITTVGASASLKQTVCNAYTIAGKKCGYASTSSAGNCTNAACADVEATIASLTYCFSYLSTCVYDGLNCVTKALCTDYSAQISGSGALINCQNLTDSSGNKCTFTTGLKCQLRACTDMVTYPSSLNCNAYLSTCLFNGSACISPEADCANYSPTGTSDAAKASICNSLSNTTPVKCTFIAGQSNCVNSVACSNRALPTTLQNASLGQLACAMVQDTYGLPCAWDPIAPSKCAVRTCALATIANSDCVSWLSGCEENPTTACSLLMCSAPKTTTTNQECGTFKKGCLTNGAGCVESTVACSGYKGTQTTCNAFVGNSIPCTNTSSAAATDPCIIRTCPLNSTAKSDTDCKTWLSTCVWRGSLGCVDPQPCSLFIGTVDSCPTFTASDGPCHGTGSAAAPAACGANNSLCTAAPSTYNTDAQCKTWGSACMTNGFGCILASTATCTSIISPLVCPFYKSIAGLFCDLASQCKTKQSTCSGFTTASDCNNIPLAGSTELTCAWDASLSTCVTLTCALLPVTLTSDSACGAVISTCTTTGAGCITKGACSTYPKTACSQATTTDIQKVCIWSNSVCRPIQCTDNTTANSDSACNTYLAGCKTTGTGCASIFTCAVFTSAAFCLFDSAGSPCLWYKPSPQTIGSCINYKQCSDITSSTHSACQAASPLCTTNGITCIAITGCANTVMQASCIVGTDGNCGWLLAGGTATPACALFTNCSASTGTTTAQCQAWGQSCVSNGTDCISQSTCSSYSTQIECGNVGTDGTCFWVAPSGTSKMGTCRLQQCQDAITNYSTHTGCGQFSAQTLCTTSGTGCIPLATCSSYTVQAGCVQGTDGICFWATATTAATKTTSSTTSSICRLKQCSDFLFNTNFFCAPSIQGVKCVSNGVNCIPQSTCSSYTAREACLGGGSDGACAFTPGTNTITPDKGTCAQFTQCSNANSDQIACNSRSDVCYFNSTITNGTTTSQCQPHTCATKALGSSCQPVPSWDLSTYQICILTETTCTPGTPASLTATTCYSNTVGTYSWSVNSSSCLACSNATTLNTNNNTISNIFAYLINLILSIALML